MFMTQQQGEELLGQPHGRDRFWRWVELSTDDVWFYVSTAYSRAAGKASRYYLLTKPSDLVSLLDETDEEFWVERVVVSVPPHINGTRRWQFHELKELIAVSSDTDIIDVDYVFKVDGNLVFGPSGAVDGDNTTRRQVLFSERRDAYPDEAE